MTEQQVILTVFIVLGVFTLLLLITYSIQLKETKIEEKIKKTSTLADFYDKTTRKIKKENKCDFLLQKGEVNVYVKVLYVPIRSQVVLNYKDTVCLHYGGTKQKGTLYPNKRYLKLDSFLKMKHDGIKLLLIYPDTSRVMMYVNECEMIDVLAKDFPYGMKLVKFEDLQIALDSIYSSKSK